METTKNNNNFKPPSLFAINTNKAINKIFTKNVNNFSEVQFFDKFNKNNFDLIFYHAYQVGKTKDPNRKYLN